jgi:hypothetical protein
MMTPPSKLVNFQITIRSSDTQLVHKTSQAAYLCSAELGEFIDLLDELECRLLVLGVHALVHCERQFLGANRTSQLALQMSTYDPKLTFLFTGYT